MEIRPVASNVIEITLMNGFTLRLCDVDGSLRVSPEGEAKWTEPRNPNERVVELKGE